MDQYDVPLEDDELMGEVELTANLIVAANQADGQLSESEIDQALGISSRARATDAQSA